MSAEHHTLPGKLLESFKKDFWEDQIHNTFYGALRQGKCTFCVACLAYILPIINEYINKEFPKSTPVLVYTNLQMLIKIELL